MSRKLIRDAVHGDIQMTALEVELMDTPEFQRLRGIKQLGTAYLVFPSAMHTRFEHSLGTSWMARRLVESIRRTHNVSADDELLIRVSALLHDITHIPFGHTLEDERRVLPRHDKDLSRLNYFLRESKTARILDREGIQDKVIAVIEGRSGFMSDIVAGAISADLLDYLRRDTYFCGLSQYYDERIFESFVVDNNRLAVNLEKHGALRRDALSELINLLRIRYSLSERVYFHHTKIASGAMISKAVELALAEGFRSDRLRVLKDDTLLFTLKESLGTQPVIGRLIGQIEARQLYKACFVLTTDIGEGRQHEIVHRFHYRGGERDLAERAIAAAAGIQTHQVIIYCPSAGMSLPEAEVPVRLEAGRLTPLSGSNNEEIRILKEKHKALWKFYVLIDREVADKSDAVKKAVEQCL
jgi:HD superfamily phosphohydrolase